MDGDFVKVLAWYDNEWGYSSRCVDLLRFLVEEGAVSAPWSPSTTSTCGPARVRARGLQRPDQGRRDHRRHADPRVAADHPHALEQGATVVLASHLGRPKGKPNPDDSLRPVAAGSASCSGGRWSSPRTASASGARGDRARAGGRGRPAREPAVPSGGGEERPGVRAALAALADVYVNDAFGAAHRAHASTEGIVAPRHEAAAGLLMAKELEYLGHGARASRSGRSWRCSAARRCRTSSR
jgi:hypothetical protein